MQEQNSTILHETTRQTTNPKISYSAPASCSQSELGSLEMKTLTTQDAWQDLSFAQLRGEPRPTYADLSLCYHNEATGPTSYVFCFKEFGYASDQIPPARGLQAYEYNSAMSAGLKLAGIGEIQVFGD